MTLPMKVACTVHFTKLGTFSNKSIEWQVQNFLCTKDMNTLVFERGLHPKL